MGSFCGSVFLKPRLVLQKRPPNAVVEEAKKKAEIIEKEGLLKAKERSYQEKTEFEKETMEKRQELQNLERRIVQKESHLDKKVELIETKEEDINRRDTVS